jgi:hypothetical protein
VKTNPNDLAYPHHEVWDADKTDIGWIGGGLTKREIFAAMALQGILSTGDHQCVFFNKGESNKNPEVAAVRIADALIAALNEERK